MKLLELYGQMTRARAFELALARLWEEGLISGEMHLGTGEEAVVAGVVSHLDEMDAMALDHRSTPPLVVRGLPLVPLLLEMLGRPDGLCGGRGGHMHLFSAADLMASSGIVGASAPLAAGFALAATRLRKGHVAVAFFGDGAMNQGMVMEAMNLAAAWSLPVLFVSKANGWSITTRATEVTGGDLLERARGLGCRAMGVDGLDASLVYGVAGELLDGVRGGDGPALMLASCSRLHGHLLGDPLLRTADSPLGQGRELLGSVTRAALTGSGEGVAARTRGVVGMLGTMAKARGERGQGADPLELARKRLDKAQCAQLDRAAEEEVQAAVSEAQGEVIHA